MTMFNRVPGLKPGLRESRRVRSKARSAPAAYEKNFDATSDLASALEPGGVLLAACVAEGSGDEPRRGGVQAAGDFKASHLRHQLFRRDHVWQ